MLKAFENNELINDIAEEVQKLPISEQRELLTKIRLSNYLKRNSRPIADYDKLKIKPPTLKQIDKWKHESRTHK